MAANVFAVAMITICLGLLAFYIWQLKSNAGKTLLKRELLLGAALSFFVPLFGAYHFIEIRKALLVSICWFLLFSGFQFIDALFKRLRDRQEIPAESHRQQARPHHHKIKRLIDWLRR